MSAFLLRALAISARGSLAGWLLASPGAALEAWRRRRHVRRPVRRERRR